MAEDPEVYQVLKPDGTLHEGTVSPLDDAALLGAMRWMLLSRAFDHRATALQRQGRFGVFSPVMGQEASVVGTALAFDPAVDWLVPQYRELPGYLIFGLPLSSYVLNLSGNPLAARIPDTVHLLPTQVAIAAQLPHAVGLAWGLKIQRKAGVVVTYVGEGGASEGDFHEACNLAGVTGAPVVFVLQNNQWAISTPRAYQSAARHLSDRAQGYGFPGVTVDGNDLLAVYEVTREAAERARGGGGPTLIETITYRRSFHNTTDNPSVYQDPKLLEEAEKRDPIERVRRHLAARGLWDEVRERDMGAAAEAEIDAALAAAAAAPPPGPDQMFENVYATAPERLRRQRESFRARGG